MVVTKLPFPSNNKDISTQRIHSKQIANLTEKEN
jgi:hypothetical protein